MGLQIAILGSLELRIDECVVGVPAGKQRALLTLLALRAPHPVSAESAADALWPRASPADAMRSLQVTVSRLRRSLGEASAALETVAAGYRLTVDADAIDARRFESLVESARTTRLEGDGAQARRLLDDALGLWRGPALADVAFESFAQGEIARLDELRLAALEERIDTRLSAGEHPLVVAELEQLAAEFPSRERLVELLMLALYRCGRQSEALAVYTQNRRRLGEELGLDPSSQLRRLEEAILRQDPALDARVAEPVRAGASITPRSAAAPARDAVRGTDRGAGPARRAARPGAPRRAADRAGGRRAGQRQDPAGERARRARHLQRAARALRRLRRGGAHALPAVRRGARAGRRGA